MLLFQLRVNSFSDNVTTVLQLCNQSNDIQGNPQIFISETNLFVLSIIDGTAKNFSVAKLDLLRWTSIKITQELVNNSYIFTVNVNETLVISIVNTQPLYSSNVFLYATSPLVFPQNGSIRDIIFIGSTFGYYQVDSMFINQETTYPSFTLLATLNILYEEFVISFETLFINKGSTILFINDLTFPEIGIYNYFISLKVLLNMNSFINIVIKENQWQSFKISQVYLNNVYNTSVNINGAVVFSQVNTQPKATNFRNIYVFMGDSPIRRLYIVTKSQATWSAWSEWSSCNISCNIASLNRTRNCTRNQMVDCLGKSIDTKSCPKIIANWNEWSIWSICASCGFQNRTRSCSTSCLNCSGSNIQTKACPCISNVWGNWGSWSTCNQSTGLINRVRYCNTPFCIGNNIETNACSSFWLQWSEWSCCDTSGFTNRTRNCSNTQQSICVGNRMEIITCNILFIGVKINVEMYQQQYELYNTTVRIFTCNSVQLILNFGDGTPVTNIKNISFFTANYFTYTAIHSYSVCQQFTISANVFENTGNKTSALFTNSTHVTVFCSLSPLKVVKTPSDFLSGYVQLSLYKYITLDIFQDTGSNMIYLIDWGDGNSTINNQTLNFSPISFQVKHMYTNANNYNVSIRCWNYIQVVTPIFINIHVSSCPMPRLHFYYGTFNNPMTIIRSVGRKLTAFIESVNSLCKNDAFTFEWNLTSSDSKPIVTKGILYHQKVTYSIAKNSLNFGVYILSLQCSYGNISAVYNAYLNVICSPLFTEIENGLFVSVAYNKKIGNESFYQDFKVSAMPSYDPDDPTVGVQSISFRWRCKVASNFSDAKVAMENFLLLNLTFLSNSCFNESWIDIPLHFSEIIFNTQQFLEEISYHIEVCGTKYAGKDVYLNDVNKTSCFVQELLFTGSVPTVTMKCTFNCDTKLNFKERMIYSFDCKDCGYQRLEANWTIEDEAGNFPIELSVPNATSTGFHIPSLVINKDILLASKNYTFILVVGYANSAKRAKIKFKKSTCSQPTPGYCVIDPAEGFSLETKFIIICNEWRDSDGLLNYAFYYDNGKSRQMKLSSTNSMDYPLLNADTTDQPSLINFVMGPGDEKNDYKIRIFIKVIGKYQAYTEYNLYIKVYPNNKPMNLKDLFSTISFDDTQSVANIVQAVSNNINENSANQYNITPTTDNDLFGIDNDSSSKQLKQQELSSLQELRTQLIDLISNTSFNDLSSFKSISDALVVVSQNPLEIVPRAQNQAVSIVDRLAGLLTNKNLKGFGAEKFDTMSQSFVNSISNLLLNVDPSSLTTSLEDVSLVPTLINSMKNYFIAAQSFKVPGEHKTKGETNQFEFLLKKDLFIDLSNSSIGSSDGGFSFPNSSDMFNESLKNSQISIHNVRMKNIVYTWDTNRSKNILSESQTLFFSDSNGLPIKVSNISQPFQVSIKNIPEKMIGNNISLSMPNDAYQVKLSMTSDCNLLLKFLFKNDENNFTNLIVYIQYGKVATKLDYDIMLNISVKQGVVMTKNNNVAYSTVTIDNKINESLTRILKRSQDVLLLDDGSIILWNFINSTYSLLNNSYIYLLFSYSGPMPAKILFPNIYNYDETEYSGTFEYELKSFCVECNYWNEDINRWMSDGCQLDVSSTSFSYTKCKCNHLTTFGGYFLAPRHLPKLSIDRLKSGYALLIAVVIVILLWLLGLLVTRRMDKHDVSKIGVCPLPDNRDEDNYLYQIIVNTGTLTGSGTKSKIFFTLTGDMNDSGIRCLKDPERECFQRSSCDTFIMTTKNTLGDLDFIRVWHDNSGGGWYVKNIIITDLQTENKYFFIGHCWIAVDRGSCNLDVILPVASVEESSRFIYVFKNKTQQKLHDEHLWFSVFFRSPHSTFTRCQRLSVAISLIMTSMLVSAMYYQQLPPVKPSVENKVGSFSFTWTQVFVILISTCIKFPVNFLLLKLFCSIRPFENEQISDDCLTCNKNEGSHKKSSSCMHVHETNNLSLNKQKLHISIEQLKWYIAWFLCVGNIFACSFVVLWYGMAFGNKTSLNWLACITIDFFKEIFVSGPLKIAIVVIILFLVVKKPDHKEETKIEKQGKRLAFDENWLHKFNERLAIFKREDTKMLPHDYQTVQKMRELGLKHQKMHSKMVELFSYTLYACLVFFIGYFVCNHLTYYQTRDVQELFNLKLRLPPNPKLPNLFIKTFKQIKTSNNFWSWLEGFFLPQIYPKPWYNLSNFYANTDKKGFPGKQFLNDLSSKLVNGVRIRQIRVKPNSCVKTNSINKLIAISCLSPYKNALEETGDFDLNWTLPKQYNSTINFLTMPWRYQTWRELDGYPYLADLDIYYGGGYVIEIFPKWKNQFILDQAKKYRWIDRQTRAIIIDFALYNAATNYFNMVTMALEFPAFGGVVPNFSVSTFNLYVTKSKVLLSLHVLFILMTMIFTIRECHFLYQAGWKYFLEFWNLVEFALILFSIVAFGLFLYKDYLAKMLLQRLPDKKPDMFINFQFASYCDMIYLGIVSLIVFFVTLKFIKYLQFNGRVSMLSSTLKAAWYPLSLFGIVFFIILCSFVTFSNIAFGALMVEYKTYNEAIISIVSLLLGKFSFNQYKIADGVLGPIFFFGFNVVVIWVLTNMFISILNDAFSVVHTNPDDQNKDHEMIDFMLKCCKGWFASRHKRTRTQTEKEPYPTSKVEQAFEHGGGLKECDRVHQQENNREPQRDNGGERTRVTFEPKFKKKNILALSGKGFEDNILKFGYPLNERKLDNEVNETIEQIFEKDLFEKFIDCAKTVHIINERKRMDEVIIMDTMNEIF